MYGQPVTLRTALPHASRVVRPSSARIRIASSQSFSSTKWSWMFCRVVTWPKPREYFAATVANARICPLLTMPCGALIRSICTPSWRWP